MREKFWVVCRSQGFMTEDRFKTKEAAMSKAMELSERESVDYFVLEAIGVTRLIQTIGFVEI